VRILTFNVRRNRGADPRKIYKYTRYELSLYIIKCAQTKQEIGVSRYVKSDSRLKKFAWMNFASHFRVTQAKMLRFAQNSVTQNSEPRESVIPVIKPQPVM
jgi:hypothetical protein